MVIANLQNILKIMKTKNPEAENLITIFTPILICEEELLQELKMKKPALSLKKQKEHIPYIDTKEFKLCTEKSNIVCQKLLSAIATALPKLKEITDELKEIIKPSTARRLIKEFIADKENREKNIEAFIQKNYPKEKIEKEENFVQVFSVLELLLTRASHTFLTRVARSLPYLEEHNESTFCPVCGGKPNMSVIKDKDGHRELLCADCGHLWRYKRSKCHVCGTEKDKNLEMVYATNKNERALLCNTCQNYIVEIDIREQEVQQENIHALSLGLAYLDAIMQNR